MDRGTCKSAKWRHLFYCMWTGLSERTKQGRGDEKAFCPGSVCVASDRIFRVTGGDPCFVINFFAGSNLILLIVGNLFTGADAVPISMLAGLIIIECAEYNEYVGIRRLEGSLGAVNGFATKVGAGLGSGILRILIGLAGYDGNLAVQPDSAITMVRLLYSLIPAVLYVIVYFVCRTNKLDKMMDEICR